VPSSISTQKGGKKGGIALLSRRQANKRLTLPFIRRKGYSSTSRGEHRRGWLSSTGEEEGSWKDRHTPYREKSGKREILLLPQFPSPSFLPSISRRRKNTRVSSHKTIKLEAPSGTLHPVFPKKKKPSTLSIPRGRSVKSLHRRRKKKVDSILQRSAKGRKKDGFASGGIKVAFL